MAQENRISAEDVSLLFKKKGFRDTPKWIEFMIKSRMPDFWQNLLDATKSLRSEIATYRHEYYDNPSFNTECYDHMLQLILKGMAAGSEKFYRLTTDLVPLAEKNIETSKKIEEIVGLVSNSKEEQKFLILCFCYQLMYEGDFKSILTTLLAMKRLAEGKKVNVSRFLRVISGEKREKSIDEVAPSQLKRGIHRHLRNAIAHAYFTDLGKDKIQFWDVFSDKDEYSMKPIELDYRQFSRYVAEVRIFCDIYGFLVLLFIAFEDIVKRSHR